MSLFSLAATLSLVGIPHPDSDAELFRCMIIRFMSTSVYVFLMTYSPSLPIEKYNFFLIMADGINLNVLCALYYLLFYTGLLIYIFYTIM